MPAVPRHKAPGGQQGAGGVCRHGVGSHVHTGLLQQAHSSSTDRFTPLFVRHHYGLPGSPVNNLNQSCPLPPLQAGLLVVLQSGT